MKSKILLLLLLFSLHAFAQDSSFQLKDYKYRTPRFQALYLGLNVSGSLSELNKDEERSDKSFSLSPSQVSYQKIVSTDKRLFQSTLSFSPYGYFSSSTINKKKVTDRNFQSYLAWQFDNRQYKTNGLFFETGNELTNEMHSYNRKDTVESFGSNRFNFQNTITLGVGKGRVERVQDAQMALYILNDLETQGLVSNKVTPDQAVAFAKLITELNNQRVFDFRRKRIYELTQIDSFLRSSGLVTTTDIRHFTTVNDNWALTVNPYRLSGSNWYVRIKPSIGNSKNKFNETSSGSIYSSNSNNFFLSLSPAVGYEKYVPVNLKWQLNMGTSFAFRVVKNMGELKFVSNGTVSTNKGDYYENFWLANGFYSVGYFPNTRTQIVTTFNLDASLKTKDYLELSPSLNFNANYFIGYRTFLRGNFGLSYKYADDQANFQRYFEGHEFTTNISMSLSHILF